MAKTSNLKLEEEFSKTPLIEEINDLKARIDQLRPLPTDVEGKVMQKFRLDWNFHSNAIEGNKLTYGETTAFLMEGITAKGKPLKDHLDIRGHNEAIDFMQSLIKEDRPLSENDIRELHKMILVEPFETKATTPDGKATTKTVQIGRYKTSPNHVETSTGFIHYYASPEETPARMYDLMEWYRKTSEDVSVHPLVLAALFHHRFVAIHPFDDGNGRMSRILMNLVLMHAGYPPVVIRLDDRKNYYALLQQADNNESWPFVEYVGELLKYSMKLYIKAAEGGDINEDEDIDKELALLKMELDSQVHLKERKTIDKVVNLITLLVIPTFERVITKTKMFDEYFFDVRKKFNFIRVNISSFYNVDELEKINVLLLEEKNKSNVINHEPITQVSLEINYWEFKNHEFSFNLVNRISFRFQTYFYEVLDDRGEKVFSKYYDENLDNTDVNLVVKSYISQFKEKLNKSKGS